jgi:glutathionylspermidine synthase
MEATFQLHNMCLEVVERVANDDVLLTLFEIPEALWPAIKKSWKEKKTDFMGRFDLAWDGTKPPKLFEYNADTPSVLVESSLAQLHWQREKHPGSWQANFMISSIISSLKKLDQKHQFKQKGTYLGIGTVKGDEESEATSEFIRNIAEKIGIPAVVGDISKLQTSYTWQTIDLVEHHTVDMEFEGKHCSCVLKMYPYEWLV